MKALLKSILITALCLYIFLASSGIPKVAAFIIMICSALEVFADYLTLKYGK